MATPQMNYALRHQLKLSGNIPFQYLPPHYSISAFIIALGFIYGAQDKLPSRGTKENPSTLLHRPAQGVQQLGRNENPSFNSYRMAAKAVSP